MVMKRTLLEKLGAFDEVFMIGDFEDSDLCLKIRDAGLRCAVDLDVQLYHLERKSQLSPGLNWRMNTTLYNAWQHQNRWGARIAEQLGARGVMSSTDVVSSERAATGRSRTDRKVRKTAEHKPLKIVVASHSHPQMTKGGAEIAAHQLFRNLAERKDCDAYFIGCDRSAGGGRLGSVFTQPFSIATTSTPTGDFDWFKFANRDPRFPAHFEKAASGT